MKKLSILLLVAMVAFSSFAQASNEKRSVFHFSFVPPLSTNGLHAAQYTNIASLSLLAGVAKNEEAFGMAGLANLVKENAGGLQMAGLVNYAGNTLRGMQLGGLVNVAGSMNGFQWAGLGNMAKDVKGFQWGGLGNIAADVKGFQLAGLGNIAADVKGFQLAGVFNVAKNVSGVQFAGLINIAQNSDYPLALLNIIKNGEYSVAATYNETGSMLLTFRSGGRITYGILGIGYNYKADDKQCVMEGGFGAHIPISSWLRLNNEVKGGMIGDFSDASAFYTHYALLPAFRVVRNFEIFGGPSINYMQSDDLKNKELFPHHSLWKKETGARLQQLYLGYQVGIQVIF